MGLFTTAIVDGKHIQFKTGWDDMEELRLGDETSIPDGVYEGYGESAGDHMIVIYKGALWAVRPWNEGLARVARELFRDEE